MDRSWSQPTCGLSQDELDALCTSASEESQKLCSPEGSEDILFDVRRKRHFMGHEAAEAFVLNALSEMPENDERETSPSVGLSQTALDALSVRANIELEEAPSDDGEEAFLHQVRRKRHFMGCEQADTLITDAMSKMAGAAESASRPVGALSQEELDALSVSAVEADEPESPAGFLLQVRRARHFKGNEAADAMIALAMTPEVTSPKQEDDIAMSDRPSMKVGLSQADLDALTISAEESCSDESAEESLVQIRRRRHFMGREQADALVSGSTSKRARAKKQEAMAGLSQEELDTMAVTTEEAEPSSPKSSDSSFHLRVRRARHFMGHEAADAMIADARTRTPEVTVEEKEFRALYTPEESADENITTASGSLSRQSSGQSLSRQYSEQTNAGLSQMELNALTVSAEETEDPCAPECSEGFLLRVRRARQFMGNEVAHALITEAVQALKDKDANDDSTASGSEDKGSSDVGIMSCQTSPRKDKEASDVGISSRRTSASGGGDKELSEVGTQSRRTSASGAGSIALPLSGFSQAELDALSEFELDAVVKTCIPADTTQKGRSKFADLEIDPDPVSDACAILKQVSSPIGGRRGGSIRFTSGPLSPQHSPRRPAAF